VELSADIVAAQARQTALAVDVMAESLRKIYLTLQDIQGQGDGVAGADAVWRDPQASIQRNQVICLECSKTFKLLSNRHLALHGLTPRTYKHKHGIRMTQALSARTLSTRRRKLAKDLGMGKQLAAWRAARKRQMPAPAAMR
jgi:predicted transcriptional regulator